MKFEVFDSLKNLKWSAERQIDLKSRAVYKRNLEGKSEAEVF